MARGDLTDEEWGVIEVLLPAERGRKSRPSHDNRRFLDGMLHVLPITPPKANRREPIACDFRRYRTGKRMSVCSDTLSINGALPPVTIKLPCRSPAS